MPGTAERTSAVCRGDGGHSAGITLRASVPRLHDDDEGSFWSVKKEPFVQRCRNDW